MTRRSDSGSRRSPIAVEPVTSQKTTVTVLRSSSPPGGPSGAEHAGQNAKSSGDSRPQFAQVSTTGAYATVNSRTSRQPAGRLSAPILASMSQEVESVLTGLNDAQREAALALRGPVAILAGAGTGKTTTITHRIACQVRSGSFEPSQILAVTFTEKAAGELKRRLRSLDVDGV